MSAAPTFRDRIKELRRVPAGDLLPSPKNWRRHPASQRAALQAILKEVGWADALIARQEGEKLVLIDGHLRADLDPAQQVPVLVLDVTEEEGDKILATLDPLAALAETDDEAMRALLESVKFDDSLLRELAESQVPEFVRLGETDPDEAPGLPKVARTKPGDLYLLGDHRVLCGDSTKPADVERLLGGLALIPDRDRSALRRRLRDRGEESAMAEGRATDRERRPWCGAGRVLGRRLSALAA
jgi:hypothetical protein